MLKIPQILTQDEDLPEDTVACQQLSLF
jgi:hypothetical protein